MDEEKVDYSEKESIEESEEEEVEYYDEEEYVEEDEIVEIGRAWKHWFTNNKEKLSIIRRQ